MPFPLPLAGALILVTGGGSGINLAFIRHCLTLSPAPRILLADLALSPPAAALAAQHPTLLHFTRTDVSSFAALAALVPTARRVFAAVPDVYVAGAGTFEPPGAGFWDSAEADGFATMRVNVEHPIKLARLAVDALLGAGKRGVVCVLGSTAGLTPIAVLPLYVASKHAVTGFVKSMRPLDAEAGVKIVQICPGIVDSPLWTAERRRAFDMTDMREFLTVEEVAAQMVRLIESAEYPGGTSLRVERLRPGEGGLAVSSVPDWNYERPPASAYFARTRDDVRVNAARAQPMTDALERARQGGGE